jgi:hypothetical protein
MIALTRSVGRDSSVCIATRYGLDGPGIESRWGRDFPHPYRSAAGAYPTFYTMDTGSFPEVRRPGCGVDHPPHLAPRLKKEDSYTSTPPLWAFLACSRVSFTLPSLTHSNNWLLLHIAVRTPITTAAQFHGPCEANVFPVSQDDFPTILDPKGTMLCSQKTWH